MTQVSSLVREVIDRCRSAAFTGVVRIRGGRGEGEGELLFLSGIVDEARAGNASGEDAVEQVSAWDTSQIEVTPRLPEEVPLQGDLARKPPLELFRFCESNALTCTLVLTSGGLTGEAQYRMGELLAVRCEGDSNPEAAVSAMLGWTSGTYRFDLPAVQLPEALRPAAAPMATAPTELAMPALSPEVAAQTLAASPAASAPAAQASAASAEAPAAAAGDPDRASRVAAMRARAAQRAAEVARAVEEARAARAAKVAKLAAEAPYLEGQDLPPAEAARIAKAKAEAERLGLTPGGPGAPTRPSAPTTPSAPSTQPAPAMSAAPSAPAASDDGMATIATSLPHADTYAAPAAPAPAASASAAPAPAASAPAPAASAPPPSEPAAAAPRTEPMAAGATIAHRGPLPGMPAERPADTSGDGSATVVDSSTAQLAAQAAREAEARQQRQPAASAQAAAQAPAREQAQKPQPQQEKSSNVGLILLIVLLVLGGAAAVAWYLKLIPGL